MTRDELLKTAARLTGKDRKETYGDLYLLHWRIAAIWTAILEIEVQPEQVAQCMAGLKLARLAGNPTHEDSGIDGAAYFGIAVELATEQP